MWIQQECILLVLSSIFTLKLTLIMAAIPYLDVLSRQKISNRRGGLVHVVSMDGTVSLRYDLDDTVVCTEACATLTLCLVSLLEATFLCQYLL